MSKFRVFLINLGVGEVPDAVFYWGTHARLEMKFVPPEANRNPVRWASGSPPLILTKLAFNWQ
jgi:hypothetical protein